MDETPRENVAIWVGIVATVVPGMIVSGFWPAWNVLPYGGWLAIAAVGSAIAGMIATPRMIRGAISGVIAGVGTMAGLWLYVMLRSSLLGPHAFFKVELVIGAMLGAAPGIALYCVWARKTDHESGEDSLAGRSGFGAEEGMG